ncbi:MAG: hydantoinase/oxoprolinase family protein [Nitriliruptoraceae bacterium]|nr:hydantoinase/oxoprolinase family protein [Nitriliruptoraceae bacterium]
MHDPGETTPLALGVDVGGTFTDLALAGPDGVRVAKVPSTPDDQATGILDGVARLELDVADLERFVHGTTVATNTVLERDGARTVLVTTAGFRDLLAIGRQDRPDLYDLAAARPAPVVPSALVVEAEERIAADGRILTALRDAEVARVVDAVAALEPDAIAVSLLFGFLDDRHERRLAEALAALERPVSVASRLLPVMREVERTSTVALNAYVAPRMDRYLGSLTARLADAGLRPSVEVMRSGGGTFTTEVAAREPVHTLLSGPAAGAWGAAALGAAAGQADLLAIDVGGTSTDVTLISGGRPATSVDGTIDGLPFAVKTTDIHTIGAGGGSIAWRDDGGALRVGPRSAGAVPGPACYDRGGTRPTVTDANLVLGRLDAEVRLGGAMRMAPERAHDAVGGLAETLGMGVTETAAGIIRVTDAQMVKAVRVVSVERGHDPRRFALVPFGGAGPLHQAALAAQLGCARVLVPPHPGVLSALGLLAAPVTVDRARSLVRPLEALDDDELASAWAVLTDDADAALREQGAEVAGRRRSADLRYRGQAFELEVAGDDEGAGRAGATVSGATLAERFHAAHRERYGYDQPGEAIEVVTVRCRVEGPSPTLPLPRLRGGGDIEHATIGTREVVAELTGTDTVSARVVDRSALGAGARLTGPAVVVGLDATVWIAAWQTGEVDDHGILVLEGAP